MNLKYLLSGNPISESWGRSHISETLSDRTSVGGQEEKEREWFIFIRIASEDGTPAIDPCRQLLCSERRWFREKYCRGRLGWWHCQPGVLPWRSLIIRMVLKCCTLQMCRRIATDMFGIPPKQKVTRFLTAVETRRQRPQLIPDNLCPASPRRLDVNI